MKYTYDEKKKKLTICMFGEMDMDRCKNQRDIVDGYIIKYSPKELELNLEKVTFMDSSGIGYLIGRYKLAQMLDCAVVITKATNNVKRIMEMSNVNQMMRVV